MTHPGPDIQFELHVAADDDEPASRETIEEFATELGNELADMGIERVERLPAGPAPAGARAAAEVYAAVQLVIGVVNTLEKAVQAIQAIRRWAVRYARQRQRLRVTVAGTEVDLADATDEQVEHIAQNLLPRPAEVPAPAGVRKALIVANAHYDEPALAQLRSPTRDAQALGGVLADPAIGGFDVQMLVDADERTVRRRVAEHFADRDRDDLLLLHFSCHGVKDPRGRLHLAARDTSLALLEATSVPASFLNDQMGQTRSGRVVLILDCCYSGAFAQGSVVRAGSEVGNEFGEGNGRVVLTASSATEYAFEDGELSRAEGRPSVFTAALVQGLRTGEADLDADGEISINDLYDYAYRAVQERTPGQAPTKWSFGIQGRLVIAHSTRPAALPATVRDDLASERVPLRLVGVEALAELLRSDKHGMRVAAEHTLAEVRDGDDSIRVRRAAGEALSTVEGTPVPAAGPDATQPAVPTGATPPPDPSPGGVDPTEPARQAATEPAPPEDERTHTHGDIVEPPEGRRSSTTAVVVTLTALLLVTVIVLVVAVLSEFPDNRNSADGPPGPGPTDEVEPGPTGDEVADASEFGAQVLRLPLSGSPAVNANVTVWSVATAEVDGTPVVVAGGENGHVHVWDLTTGDEMYELTHTLAEAVESVATGEVDGTPVAVSGGRDETVRVWDLTTGEELYTLTGHTDLVSTVAVSQHDGTPVAVSSGDDGTTRLWDLTTGEQIGQPTEPEGTRLVDLDGSPVGMSDDREGDDVRVRFRDLSTGEQIGETLVHTADTWTGTLREVEGTLVAVTGSLDGTVRVWNLDTGEEMFQFSHARAVQATAVGELDGTPIAVSGGGTAVRVWDLTTGEQIGDAFRHSASVDFVFGERDGVALGELDGNPIAVAGGNDGTVRVWSLANPPGLAG